MERQKYTQAEEKNMEKEMEFMFSLNKMNREQLMREVMLQRQKLRAVQQELDDIKFLMADSAPDTIYIPAYKAMKKKLNQ